MRVEASCGWTLWLHDSGPATVYLLLNICDDSIHVQWVVLCMYIICNGFVNKANHNGRS